MTLKDKIDDEISSVNEENIESIVKPFSLLESAEAYINSHPNEPYGQILNSGEDQDIISIRMKGFVYGKILDQLITAHESIMPNVKKYERWVEEQQEYVNNIPYHYGLTPEEMTEQYNSLLRGMGRYKIEIREKIKEMRDRIKNLKSEKE